MSFNVLFEKFESIEQIQEAYFLPNVQFLMFRTNFDKINEYHLLFQLSNEDIQLFQKVEQFLNKSLPIGHFIHYYIAANYDLSTTFLSVHQYLIEHPIYIDRYNSLSNNLDSMNFNYYLNNIHEYLSQTNTIQTIQNQIHSLKQTLDGYGIIGDYIHLKKVNDKRNSDLLQSRDTYPQISQKTQIPQIPQVSDKSFDDYMAKEYNIVDDIIVDGCWTSNTRSKKSLPSSSLPIDRQHENVNEPYANIVNSEYSSISNVSMTYLVFLINQMLDLLSSDTIVQNSILYIHSYQRTYVCETLLINNFFQMYYSEIMSFYHFDTNIMGELSKTPLNLISNDISEQKISQIFYYSSQNNLFQQFHGYLHAEKADIQNKLSIFYEEHSLTKKFYELLIEEYFLKNYSFVNTTTTNDNQSFITCSYLCNDMNTWFTDLSITIKQFDVMKYLESKQIKYGINDLDIVFYGLQVIPIEKQNE